MSNSSRRRDCRHPGRRHDHPDEQAVGDTVNERSRFLRAAEESVYRAFYRMLIDTGLRPGEACALRWTDVDFTRETINVQRTVTRGADRNAIIAEPKTARSRRTAPMIDGLRDELRRHLDWQREHNLDATGLVLTNTAGRPLRPWTFSTRDLGRVLKVAGIAQPVTLYSLRHFPGRGISGTRSLRFT